MEGSSVSRILEKIYSQFLRGQGRCECRRELDHGRIQTRFRHMLRYVPLSLRLGAGIFVTSHSVPSQLSPARYHTCGEGIHPDSPPYVHKAVELKKSCKLKLGISKKFPGHTNTEERRDPTRR